MNAAGLEVREDAIEEAWLVARCANCESSHRLSDTETRESGEQTEYVCPSCGAVFIVVGPSPGLSGYRLRDHVIHALRGMWLRTPSMGDNSVYVPPPGDPTTRPQSRRRGPLFDAPRDLVEVAPVGAVKGPARHRGCRRSSPRA
jgi:hypothetical protein